MEKREEKRSNGADATDVIEQSIRALEKLPGIRFPQGKLWNVESIQFWNLTNERRCQQ